MPNRQMIGGELYRYAFQGQEKDSETGKEAFQLRLWDGRIGRWLTTDPKHDGYSPYWGMNNNPINIIDPDGGSGDDWYKDANGNLVYNESINTKADFDKLNIAGTYLGKTHIEGGMYYSLFGNILDLNSLHGKFTQSMDNAIINYAKDITNPDLDPDDGSRYRRYTNFDIGYKYSKNNMGTTFDYAGVKVGYRTFNNPSSLNGIFSIGTGKFSDNSNYGFSGKKSGYNMSVLSSTSLHNTSRHVFKIVEITHGTRLDYDNFYNKIRYEFFGVKNPNPQINIYNAIKQ